MSESVGSVLGRIVKGAGIVLAGIVISRALALFSRIVIARAYTPGDYGAYSMGITIATIGVTIALVGLPEAIARFTGIEKAKKRDPGVIASTGLFLGLGLATIVTLLLASISRDVSLVFLHDEGARIVLIVFSLGILAQSAIALFSAMHRGHERPEPKALYGDILPNALLSARLYATTGIHQFTRSYLKSVLVLVVILPLVSTLAEHTQKTILEVVLLLALFLALYATGLIITKTIDEQDKEIIRRIIKKILRETKNNRKGGI